MKFLSCEKISEHKYKTPEGYLICVDSILARTGKQTYKRSEVFGVDCKDADNDVEIDRTEKEVFSDKTLASFENKPLTVEHPDEDVNIDNHNELAVGFVRDIKRGKVDGQDVMLGTLVVTDAKTIEEIENGEHTDLSCGYDCDIIDEDNPQQRNIRGNHVALCQQGRAGIARIVDSKIKDEYHQIDMTDPWGGTHSLIVKAFSFEEAKKKAEKFKPEWKFRAGYQASERFVELAKRRGLYVDSWDEDDDDLSNEEKELCDYMLNNVYEKGMSPEKLLDKMLSYYSLYQRLAKHKPEDVKEYFREKIRTGYYDSIKDNYYTESDKKDKQFVKEALSEMRRYVNNWSFMSAKEKRDIGSLSELKARIKELERVQDSINDNDYFWKYLIVLENDYYKNRLDKYLDGSNDFDDAKYVLENWRKSGHNVVLVNSQTKQLVNPNKATDSLREPTSVELKKFEDYLISKHWHVKKLGKTWTGRIHYEVSKLLKTNDDTNMIIKEIDAAEEYAGLSMTYSVGSTGKELKGVVDIDAVYVKDSDTYKIATKKLKEQAKKEMKDDASDDWMSSLWDENIQFNFINGGYGMKFKSQRDYNRAKELARKYRMTKGHWYDKDLEYFDYGSTQIGNEDSVKDYQSQKESNDRMERLPLQARNDMKKASNKKAELLAIKSNIEDIIDAAEPSLKADLRKRGNKIISDLEKMFNLTDSLKTFKLKHKDSKGNIVVDIVKAKSLTDAIRLAKKNK